jgi:hypothetical protein
VARQITATTRANGKPTPLACELGCGYRAWFSSVSGIEIPLPSTSLTARPRQHHCGRARVCNCRPVSRARPLTIDNGSRARARQYAPVRVLPGFNPQAARCTAHPLTAFWHELSASSACCMNIDSVTVGGYSRSRCGGLSVWVASSNGALVSTLKKAIESVERARRSILLRYWCWRLRALRSMGAGLWRDRTVV